MTERITMAKMEITMLQQGIGQKLCFWVDGLESVDLP
jgi:hypothetical protein